MKIFIVRYSHYEDNTILSVWDSLEKAQIAMEKSKENYTWDKNCIDIQEYEVNAECP